VISPNIQAGIADPRRLRADRSGPHRGVNLVAYEDPAPTQLVPGQYSPARIFEHRRQRKVQELGDIATIQNAVAGQGREERGSHAKQISKTAQRDTTCVR